jgi:hypothetical protein
LRRWREKGQFGRMRRLPRRFNTGSLLYFLPNFNCLKSSIHSYLTRNQHFYFRKMEVDSVAEPESLLSQDDLAMEIAIREAFVEDLANLAIVSPTRVQDLYQKYVKRPRKYKSVFVKLQFSDSNFPDFRDFELPKIAATHLAMAAKHFVAHVLQIGLQHHLTQKPGELVIEYDDMAEAIASDPRMKKLQGMLPRRITFEEAVKLRKQKFKAKEASQKKEREELLAYEEFVPQILKSRVILSLLKFIQNY